MLQNEVFYVTQLADMIADMIEKEAFNVPQTL